MKGEKGQALVEIALIVIGVLVLLFIVWPWINLTLVPWLVAVIQGALAGNITAWVWLIVIIVILAVLFGRRRW